MKRSGRLVLVALLVLLAVRAVAPTIIRSHLNGFLAEFSPVYRGHIEDLDLGILRGAYRLEGVTFALKDGRERPFVRADSIDVSLAWRELLRGRIVSDVIADRLHFVFERSLREVFTAVPDDSVAEAEQARKKIFPVAVTRVELRQSSFESPDIPGFSAEAPLRLRDIDASVSGLIGGEAHLRSPFRLRGTLFEGSILRAAGTLDLAAKPVTWVVGAEVRGFDLPAANPITRRTLPLTFERGKLDLFTEVKSEDGKITGYLKPFVRDLAVVGDERDFANLRHFGIEAGVATINALFRNREKGTVATRILFSLEDGDFDWNASAAFTDLFQNGYREELEPGLENLLVLREPETQKEN